METLISKYNGVTLPEYLESHKHDDDYDAPNYSIDYYMNFLKRTDYVPNKLIECQVLNVDCQDYTDILLARKFAREQIDSLADVNYFF